MKDKNRYDRLAPAQRENVVTPSKKSSHRNADSVERQHHTNPIRREQVRAQRREVMQRKYE
jgi:hypothetical protein